MGEGSGDMPGVTSDTRRRWPGWASYAASAWALAFAAVHLYGAFGGIVYLPKCISVDMNPDLFVIDVLAGLPLSCTAGPRGSPSRWPSCMGRAHSAWRGLVTLHKATLVAIMCYNYFVICVTNIQC